MQTAPEQAPDVTDCDREPIHIPGSIQPHGALVVFYLPDWTVGHASENIDRFLDEPIDTLTGREIGRIFPPDLVHSVRNALQEAMATSRAARIFDARLLNGSPVDLGVTCDTNRVIVEVEPRAEDRPEIDMLNTTQQKLSQLRAVSDPNKYFRLVAGQVRSMTGYDRVMIYKFHEDDTGEVIAEDCRPGLESYLNLRYPASDIPKQARDLYTKQWLRIIPDADYAPVPIRPEKNLKGEPIDLGNVSLRSVSPIHVQYLKNMGVSATLTLSLLEGDRLWGLVACHHYAPKNIPVDVRTALEIYSQLVSMQIESHERALQLSLAEDARSIHDQIVATLDPRNPLHSELHKQADLLMKLVPSHGLAVWVENNLLISGSVPSEKTLSDIRLFLNASSTGIFSLDELGKLVDRQNRDDRNVCGMLAIPISRTPRDYILFFRQEVATTVFWGGNPDKAASVDPKSGQLSPRNSFEKWKQVVRGKSQPWSDIELQAASLLRGSMLEAVVRRQDIVVQEKSTTSQRQDVLIAELNHRVKNILSLISSLVTQAADTAPPLNEFVKSVQGRIAALAKAHDQAITGGAQGIPLSELVAAEVAPWVADRSSKWSVAGPSVGLNAAAAQTIALVLHELATNSAKYGAFGTEGGKLDVTWSRLSEGELELSWREHVAKLITPPTTKGFGTTVIERTVPFDLGGRAMIEFRKNGLQAVFVIPAKFVVSLDVPVGSSDTGEIQASPVLEDAEPVADLSGATILLAEDELLIAMECEHMLRQAGAADVKVAPDIETALSFVEDVPALTIAILDINLGESDSEPVANALLERGIPFIYASGYTKSAEGDATSHGKPVVVKPYQQKDLLVAIGQELFSGDNDNDA